MTFIDQPHLKEINNLYRKVRDFEQSVHLKHQYTSMEKNHRYYIKEDIDTVINAFSNSFGLSSEESGHFKEAMRNGSIDFLILKDDTVAEREEEFPVLFILSRPFFKAMKKATNMDNIYWQNGKCPVCAAVPSLSILEQGVQRKYCCSFCGSIGHYMRIGCPYCNNQIPEKINIMYPEDRKDVRIDTCNNCKSYVKTFQAALLEEQSLDETDLISLPFDIVAQNKGFHRRSPNPVGIVKIS
jgi:FdhE protein